MRGDCKCAKHKLSRGVWGHAPQENFQNYLFETCHLFQISLYISLNMKTGYNDHNYKNFVLINCDLSYNYAKQFLFHHLGC